MKNFLLLLSVLLIGCVSVKSPAGKSGNLPAAEACPGTWAYNRNGYTFATLHIRADRTAFFDWEVSGSRQIELYLNNPDRPRGAIVLYGRLHNNDLLITFPHKKEMTFVKAGGPESDEVPEPPEEKLIQSSPGQTTQVPPEDTGPVEKTEPAPEDYRARALTGKTEKEIQAAVDRFVAEKREYASLVISDRQNKIRRLNLLLFPRAQKYEIETILLYAGAYAPDGPSLAYSPDKPADALPEQVVLQPAEEKALTDFLTASGLQPENGYFYQKDPATGQAGYYQYYLAAFLPYEEADTLYDAVMLFWEKILNRKNTEIRYLYPETE